MCPDSDPLTPPEEMAERLTRYAEDYAAGRNWIALVSDEELTALEDRCAELEVQAETLEVIKRGLEARCRRRSQEDVPQPKIACRLHGMSEAVVLPNGHRECWLCVRGAMER